MVASDFERAYNQFKPRKATVIATGSGEVRVRLHRDGAEPARWFPAVVATVPVGTEGVLLRANREESLFIPENIALAAAAHTHSAADVTSGTLAIGRIPTGTTSATVSLGNHTHDNRYFTEAEVNALLLAQKPETDSNGATQSLTISAPGTGAANSHLVTNAAISITGLANGSQRKVTGSVTINANAATAALARFGFVVTSNSTSAFVSMDSASVGARDGFTFTYTTTRTIGSNGTVTIVPAVLWTSGTINVTAGYATITVI